MKAPEKKKLLCNNGIEDATIILHNLDIDAWHKWIDECPLEGIVHQIRLGMRNNKMGQKTGCEAIRKMLKGD